MHLADVTMFHAPSSGGVRTYLQAKRQYLDTLPEVRHSLLVPGAEQDILNGQHTLKALRVPLGHGYRFPLRRMPWRDNLIALKPDVIEAGDPYVTAWAALDAGQALGVPVVGFYHSDLPNLMGDRLGRRVYQRLVRYVVTLYQRFDSVLVPCSAMAQRLEQWGIQRVRVQPLGVDLDTFRPDRFDPDLRRRHGIADDQRLLVFIGRHSREKNIDVLLTAMKQLGNDYHLLLMGPGMPAYRAANVTVVGRYCGVEEVARVLASSDALLHAGTRETFGLITFEAMASGIPVVAARAGALAENIPLGTGILCKPHDPDDMAHQVRNLFHNDAQACGRYARGLVERQFSWNAVIKRQMAHYAELVTDPSWSGKCPSKREPRKAPFNRL